MKYSMSLEPDFFDNDPETANGLMEVEWQRLFNLIMEQIQQGRICHAECTYSPSSFLSTDIVISVSDKREELYHLPDDTDLHYPVSGNENHEVLASDIWSKTFKYRDGVYIWLAEK